MKNLPLEEIQRDIHNYLSLLKDGSIDAYDFIYDLSQIYFANIDDDFYSRDWDECNPYLDLLFSLLEINGVELY